MNLFLIVSILSFLLLLFYTALIIFYIKNWRRLEKFYFTTNKFSTKVTIIIAARNEQANIGFLLSSLLQQNYPSQLVEIIVMDDFSDDDTVKNATEYVSRFNNLRIIEMATLDKLSEGKKAAINTGIKMAAGELIVTTDADCSMNGNWLVSLVSYYEKYKPKMLVAPVVLKPQNNFGKLQQLEFTSLMASTAATFSAGRPLMCNGANLAFTRNVFFDVNGFENNTQTATGDDTFLMFKIADKYPGQVHFINSPDALVFTPVQPDLKSFIAQRIRWASKTTLYKKNYVLLTGILIAAVNAVLIITLIASIFHFYFLFVFGFVLTIKSFFDYLFLAPVISFYKIQNVKKWFIPLELLYPFYILFIAVRSQTGGFIWKGRKLS